MKIDPRIKIRIGFKKTDSDTKILEIIKERKRRTCKPCWELKYCPYGPLVEEFPLLPPTLEHMLGHVKYLENCLDTKTLGDGQILDKEKEKYFIKCLTEFNRKDYPKSIHPDIEELKCTVFGHLCPVYFVAEPFTETEQTRRRGRYIPFDIKMRVVRRDNYTCQICGKHLLDNEVEFDHLIPLSKGGSTEEHNLRLTCYDCNREKSNKIKI